MPKRPRICGLWASGCPGLISKPSTLNCGPASYICRARGFDEPAEPTPQDRRTCSGPRAPRGSRYSASMVLWLKKNIYIYIYISWFWGA